METKTELEEILWSQAKDVVETNSHTLEEKFADKEWALVNALYNKLKEIKES